MKKQKTDLYSELILKEKVTIQMLDLTWRIWKQLINMFKALKENIVTVKKQIKILSREIETVKKNQMEIWELKCTVTDVKN